MSNIRPSFALIAACSATFALPANAATDTDSQHACALAQVDAEPLFRVPFRIVDGRIYTDVRVNGQGPFTFAIDTGASGLGRADLSLVKALEMPFVGDGRASDGVSTQTVPTVRFDRLEIGGYASGGMEVMARDYAGRMAPEQVISGIIGRDFFAEGTLVIDYPAKMLSYTKAAMIDPEATDALPYERPFRVPLTIGDEIIEANLDTGANVEMVLPQVLYERLSVDPLATAAAATLTNNTVETQQGRLHGPFRLGAAEFTDVTVRVSDRFQEMMVGARMLQNYRIVIDQPGQLIAICP